MNNPRPIILGSYSPSQNGIVVSPHGIALCIAGGGKGHDVDKPKILITYDWPFRPRPLPHRRGESLPPRAWWPWRVQIPRQAASSQSVAVEQFDNNSNQRQPPMRNIYLIHEARTEHAKAVRRRTGTNDFRDKEWHLRSGRMMQCIGTFLTTDNLIAICYE